MRQVIQFLLGKFGAHNNSEINGLVTSWYNNDFTVKGVDVTLRDVSEGVFIKTLEHAINLYGLRMDDLKNLALLPYLSENKCDLKLRVYPLSDLIKAKLSNVCSIEVGHWSVDDDVVIKDAAQHIVVHKNGFNPQIEGMFINGVVIAEQEDFSIFLTKDEILGISDFINQTMLNGVQVCDHNLLMKVVERSLFYRLVDSYVGFNLSMEEPELIEVVQMMVASQSENNAPKSDVDPNIYSSWGERIGIAYKRFDISDIKKAQDIEPPAKKQPLKMVVNNDKAKSGEDEPLEVKSENLEYCDDWGCF